MIYADAIELSILGPAFVTGLLVLATHVSLGRQVISKGIIFIDLAIAQIAALGVLIALSLGFDAHGWQFQMIAISSALMAAFILSWCETQWPKTQEAIIGISFVLAATAALIVVSKNPHGREYLNNILAGQILWTNWSQVLALAIVTAILITLMTITRFTNRSLGFYLIFAVAITTTVQIIGVYLVFASLILPALATINCENNRQNYTAWSLGAIGYAAGLLTSALLDLPTGPAIVWALALITIAWRLPRLLKR
ncbi:MAG: metal ABC transporter permease [Gammaproteobacteria bacterium]|nr:metal ABC transporter permease [Gammaproteobacteria bacterium]